MQLHLAPLRSTSTLPTTTSPLPPPPPSKIFLKTKRTKTKKTKIHRTPTPKPKSLPYPKPIPTPLLMTPPLSSLSTNQAITQVLLLLKSSISNNIRITPSIFSSLLESLFTLNSAIRHVALLHSLIPPSLLHKTPSISSKLLRLYSIHGHIEKAKQIFDLMPQRNKTNAFIWNSLISGYVELGQFEDAMAIYHQMDEEEIEPDKYTFPRVLKACAGIGSVEHGQAVHRNIVRMGFGNDAFVLNALVDMYAKCGDIVKARRIFDWVADRDSVTWNSMIVGYLRHGLVVEAMDTCQRMIGAGIEPDSITISAMLAKFSSIEIHGWVLRRGLDKNLSVSNSLIGLYSENNQLSRALAIFESIKDKDIVSWNAIISAHQRDHRIFHLFQEMEKSGQVPDKVTFVSLLSACARLRRVREGKKLFSKMMEVYEIKPEMVHYGCTVNLLARAGEIEEAYEIITMRMPFDAGPTVWGALLYGCFLHGDVRIGEVAAERLFELEPDNELNFELLMKIYRDKGNSEGVKKVMKLMRDRGLELKGCV